MGGGKGRALAVNVAVPNTGSTPARYFEAGQVPPKEYADLITNPKAWGGQAGDESTSSDPTGPVPPPKGGAGSGAEAWREYAAAVEVEVAEDASREDVIEALEKAGKPTEVEPA